MRYDYAGILLELVTLLLLFIEFLLELIGHLVVPLLSLGQIETDLMDMG